MRKLRFWRYGLVGLGLLCDRFINSWGKGIESVFNVLDLVVGIFKV